MSNKAEKLKIYLPFLDYIVRDGVEEKCKYLDIKNWIIKNRRFVSSTWDKLEDTIWNLYTLRYSKDKNFPITLRAIFKKRTTQLVAKISLCSSDEDSDVEVVPVTPTKTIVKDKNDKRRSESSPDKLKEIEPINTVPARDELQKELPQKSFERNNKNLDFDFVDKSILEECGKITQKYGVEFEEIISALSNQSTHSSHSHKQPVAIQQKDRLPITNLNPPPTENELLNTHLVIEPSNLSEVPYIHTVSPSLPSSNDETHSDQNPASRRVNLNDPRIRKQLGINHQNNPETLLTEATRKNGKTTSSITYGQYRRNLQIEQEQQMKEAEKEMEIEKQRQQNDLVQKVSTESCEYFRNLLVSSLQPHVKQIAEKLPEKNVAEKNTQKINASPPRTILKRKTPTRRKSVTPSSSSSTKSDEPTRRKSVASTSSTSSKTYKPTRRTSVIPSKRLSSDSVEATRRKSVTPTGSSSCANDKRMFKVYRELSCSVKGYQNIPLNNIGKRITSLRAREVIANQLGSSLHPIMERKSKSEPTIPIKNRRKSLQIEINCFDRKTINDELTPPMRKRRKSMFFEPSWSVCDGEYGTSLNGSPKLLLRRIAEPSKHKLTKRDLSCTVKLKRISEKEIKKYTKKNKKNVKEMPLNTCREMTERNTKICVICGAKPQNLTNHYWRSHKSESYVARLSTSELDDLQDHIPFAERIYGVKNANNQQKYRIKCRFCSETFMDAFNNFHNHFSTHTGEYAFMCGTCNFLKPFRGDIQVHLRNSKNCRLSKIRTFYQYPKDLMVIYLYCCIDCNFVQLNEANIFRHLRTHHSRMQNDPNCVKKYILAAIRDPNIQLPSPTSQTINGISNLDELPEDENDVLVSNEPLTEENIIIESQHQFLYDAYDTSSYLNDRESNLEYNTLRKELPYRICHKPFMESDSVTIKTEGNMEVISTSTLSKLNFGLVNKPQSVSHYYKSYDKETSYNGLFKCMAHECFFHSDNNEEMKSHLIYHFNSQDPPIGILNCPYCDLKESSPSDLVEHILVQHGSSSYQCQSCIYRSCIVSNVVVHQNVVHNNKNDDITSTLNVVVYECLGSVNESQKMASILDSFKNNVKPFICPVCPAVLLYTKKAMQEHWANIHNRLLDDTILIEQYACIYCDSNFESLRKVQIHLAISHPHLLPYVCERVLATDTEIDCMENLKMINVSFNVPNANIVSVWCNINEEEEEEFVKEEKPSPEQFVEIQTNVVVAFLKKLVSDTGLSPDRLYQCPKENCGAFLSTYAFWTQHLRLLHNDNIYQCPHCETKDIDEKHFQNHLRHLFLCFYCGVSFRHIEFMQNHIKTYHTDVVNLRIESIKVNDFYSYSIGIEENLNTERLQFLNEFYQILLNRNLEIEEQKSKNVITEFPITPGEYILDKFAPLMNVAEAIECPMYDCKLKYLNPQSLLAHIQQSHLLQCYGQTTCKICKWSTILNGSWTKVLNHILEHQSEIISICGLCSERFYVRQEIQHMKIEHPGRDVPVLQLKRTRNSIRVTILIYLAQGRKTITTVRDCFCCTDDITDTPLAIHLKECHNLFCVYFCEICNEKITSLQDCDEHQSKHHMGLPLKIYLNLATSSEVTISSLSNPLKFDVKFISKSKMRIKNKVKRTSDNIKRENGMESEDEDDDIIMLEGDDIIIQNEFQSEKNLLTQNMAKINCITTNKLLQKPNVPQIQNDEQVNNEFIDISDLVGSYTDVNKEKTNIVKQSRPQIYYVRPEMLQQQPVPEIQQQCHTKECNMPHISIEVPSQTQQHPTPDQLPMTKQQPTLISNIQRPKQPHAQQNAHSSQPVKSMQLIQLAKSRNSTLVQQANTKNGQENREIRKIMPVESRLQNAERNKGNKNCSQQSKNSVQIQPQYRDINVQVPLAQQPVLEIRQQCHTKASNVPNNSTQMPPRTQRHPVPDPLPPKKNAERNEANKYCSQQSQTLIQIQPQYRDVNVQVPLTPHSQNQFHPYSRNSQSQQHYRNSQQAPPSQQQFQQIRPEHQTSLPQQPINQQAGTLSTFRYMPFIP